MKTCPHCQKENSHPRWKYCSQQCKQTARDRRRGKHLARDENHPYKPMRDAYLAESTVAGFFGWFGFRVDRTLNKGPDLVIHLPDGPLTVEVKKAVKRKNRSGWIVDLVAPGRKQDDLIAIVFPEALIHIEPMSEHLGKCWAPGSRGVTNLYNALRQDIPDAGHGDRFKIG